MRNGVIAIADLEAQLEAAWNAFHVARTFERQAYEVVLRAQERWLEACRVELGAVVLEEPRS